MSGEWMPESCAGCAGCAGPQEEPDTGSTDPKLSPDTEVTTDEDGYDPDGLEDAQLSQRIAEDWLTGRYCWAAGLGWLKWNKRRWKPITDAAITEVIRRALRKHAADDVARGANATRMKQLAGLLNLGKIGAVTRLARGIVEVEADQFDAHPDLLNVNNGIIELATGELLSHDPTLLLTKITAADYNPGARHDDWDRALTAFTSPEVADWMQTRFGQAASGHMTPDDILAVLQGSGANGKSTIVKAVYGALGDHATVIPDRLLLANPGDHPTELMTLRGARFALIEELPEGRHLNIKRLKDTVGTSPVTARYIAKDNVTFPATHSLMLTTNYIPLIDEVDHATWRRLALIEFPYTFTANPQTALDKPTIPGLRDRLVRGADGRREAVLAWIVQGARHWYAADQAMPSMPEVVEEATNRWRADADRIFAYCRERLIPDPDGYVTATDLYGDFISWHEGHGNRPWSDQTFTTRFEHHSEVRGAGIERRRLLTSKPGLSRPDTGGFLRDLPQQATSWVGVRFRARADDFEGETVDVEMSSDLGKSDHLQGLQGLSDAPSRKNPISKLPRTPATPAQSAEEVAEAAGSVSSVPASVSGDEQCPGCPASLGDAPSPSCDCPDLHAQEVLA